MSSERDTSPKGDFLLDERAVVAAIENSFSIANVPNDSTIARFEHDPSKSYGTHRMLEGAKHTVALVAVASERPNEALRSAYMGAALGVYVAELCAVTYAISPGAMYVQWTKGNGWSGQVQHYTETSAAQYGKNAFDYLPPLVGGIAVRFAIDSKYIASVEETTIGYGLTLGPLYRILDDMYSERLRQEMDAEAAELFKS